MTQTATKTSKPRKTTGKYDRHGRVYATGGAVQQQGVRPVSLCNRCHASVVWLKSKRTGGWYLAQVYDHADGPFYVGADLHRCPTAPLVKIDQQVSFLLAGVPALGFVHRVEQFRRRGGEWAVAVQVAVVDYARSTDLVVTVTEENEMLPWGAGGAAEREAAALARMEAQIAAYDVPLV
jgi:hypothetical protein